MVDNQRFCDIYDENFQKIDVAYGYPNAEQPLCDKETTNELLDISKKLSEEFDFVRVDLYCNDGKILFSELTFTSGGGSVSFDPHSYDKEFGKFFCCQHG